MTTSSEKRFVATHIDDVPPQRCPCGTTQRAFADDPDKIATFHKLTLSDDPTPHYHKKITEIYHIIEGEGHMELDGEQVPVRPGSTVMIKPGCRHRAVGQLKINLIAIPAFDPEDEWFD